MTTFSEDIKSKQDSFLTPSRGGEGGKKGRGRRTERERERKKRKKVREYLADSGLLHCEVHHFKT